MEQARRYYGQLGPFLVVVPLSSASCILHVFCFCFFVFTSCMLSRAALGHWQRECERWSDLNAVVFHGNRQAKKNILRYEWNYPNWRNSVTVVFCFVFSCFAFLFSVGSPMSTSKHFMCVFPSCFVP